MPEWGVSCQRPPVKKRTKMTLEANPSGVVQRSLFMRGKRGKRSLSFRISGVVLRQRCLAIKGRKRRTQRKAPDTPAAAKTAICRSPGKAQPSPRNPYTDPSGYYQKCSSLFKLRVTNFELLISLTTASQLRITTIFIYFTFFSIAWRSFYSKF